MTTAVKCALGKPFLPLTIRFSVHSLILMAAPQGKFYAILGQRIREARQAASLTQEELAQMVGLTRTSITNIEKGRQPVPAHLLVQIGDAVRSSPAGLLPPTSSVAASDPVAQAVGLPVEARDFVAKVMRLPQPLIIEQG